MYNSHDIDSAERDLLSLKDNLIRSVRYVDSYVIALQNQVEVMRAEILTIREGMNEMQKKYDEILFQLETDKLATIQDT